MRVVAVTTCMGRAHHLRKTLPTWFAQDYPNFYIIVVDWSSPDDLDDLYWKYAFSQPIGLLHKWHETKFNQAAARNHGADHAFRLQSAELLLFIDADILLPSNFVTRNVEAYKKYADELGHGINAQQPFLQAKKLEDGACDIWGSCIVSATGWNHVKYNESFESYGHDDNEFYNALEANGYVHRPMIVDGVQAIQHDDESRCANYGDTLDEMQKLREENRKKFRYSGRF